jgi:hypothetical protein
MWTKVKRTKSKELKPETETKSPTKPTDPSKPPYPYMMTPSESQQYRWRWVEAGLDANDTEEQWEAAAYCIEVLRTLGVEDVPAYIGKVERMMLQDQAYERRRLRIAAFSA